MSLSRLASVPALRADIRARGSCIFWAFLRLDGRTTLSYRSVKDAKYLDSLHKSHSCSLGKCRFSINIDVIPCARMDTDSLRTGFPKLARPEVASACNVAYRGVSAQLTHDSEAVSSASLMELPLSRKGLSTGE